MWSILEKRFHKWFFYQLMQHIILGSLVLLSLLQETDRPRKPYQLWIELIVTWNHFPVPFRNAKPNKCIMEFQTLSLKRYVTCERSPKWMNRLIKWFSRLCSRRVQTNNPLIVNIFHCIFKNGKWKYITQNSFNLLYNTRT
jgi:hypothetical protein